MKYNDKEKSLHESPFALTKPINGSPVLKFLTQFTSYVDSGQTKQSTKSKLADNIDYKRKLHGKQSTNKLPVSQSSRNVQQRIRAGSSYIYLRDKRSNRVKRGPMYWYLEDEIAAAKDALWKQKQRIYNEEMNRNTQIGRERCKHSYLINNHFNSVNKTQFNILTCYFLLFS